MSKIPEISEAPVSHRVLQNHVVLFGRLANSEAIVLNIVTCIPTNSNKPLSKKANYFYHPWNIITLQHRKG